MQFIDSVTEMYIFTSLLTGLVMNKTVTAKILLLCFLEHLVRRIQKFNNKSQKNLDNFIVVSLIIFIDNICILYRTTISSIKYLTIKGIGINRAFAALNIVFSHQDP